MIKRGFTLVVYVFLLLFAQQGALTHAAWHGLEHPTQHRQDKGKASFQSNLCGLHGVFAEVLGGMQAVAIPIAIAQQVVGSIAYRAFPCVDLEALFPLSRGPPVSS